MKLFWILRLETDESTLELNIEVVRFCGAVSKAMRKSGNSVIPCSAEIDLTRIPTNGILMEIN